MNEATPTTNAAAYIMITVQCGTREILTMTRAKAEAAARAKSKAEWKRVLIREDATGLLLYDVCPGRRTYRRPDNMLP